MLCIRLIWHCLYKIGESWITTSVFQVTGEGQDSALSKHSKGFWYRQVPHLYHSWNNPLYPGYLHILTTHLPSNPSKSGFHLITIQTDPLKVSKEYLVDNPKGIYINYVKFTRSHKLDRQVVFAQSLYLNEIHRRTHKQKQARKRWWKHMIQMWRKRLIF